MKSQIIDVSIYKEAVNYTDIFNGLSKRLGQGSAVTTTEIYQMFLDSPNAFKRAKQNRLFNERKIKKVNPS